MKAAPCPARVAEFVELGRHRIERGPRLGEGGRAAGGQDGQLALRRALRAAGDRRVEIMPAGGLQLLGEPARDVRVHGGGGDEHGVLGQRLGDAVLAEQDGLGLRGVDDHADHDVGRLRAASAGVFAPWPPSATNRATASAETSQPVTSKPARRSEVAMPKPIEPRPITATRGLADIRHRRVPSSVSLTAAIRRGLLPAGITAWPRCQSMRQGEKGKRKAVAMSETKLREDICRLGRSLFERGLTPGSSGNISVRLDDGGWLVTPTNASLGFLDPARLSRLDADGRLVSGDAPTKEIPLHTALYETRGAARAVVHLHSTHSVALSMLPEIDPARRCRR